MVGSPDRHEEYSTASRVKDDDNHLWVGAESKCSRIRPYDYGYTPCSRLHYAECHAKVKSAP